MLLILLAAAFLLPSTRGAALIASFYGDSFVYLPYEDARSTSDIKLQFKTPFAYGLLFAALGTKDYIVVYLEEGNVNVRFNLGSGETTLRSTLQRFDDSRWHAVSVERENETVTLVMDGELVVNGRSPGRSSELNLDLGLFVADLGSYYALFEPTVNAVIRPRSFAPYRGCLVHVTFNSESVLEMALHNEQNPTPRNSSALPKSFSKRPASAQVEYAGCPDEFDAYSSDQVPNTVSLLTNISYFALPPIQFQVGGTFSFELRTTVQTGVVFINYDATGSLNFLSIELFNGYVTMTYAKSGERIRLQSSVFVSDANWHVISVSITSKTITLKVDGATRAHQAGAGDLRCSFNGRLHFNGLPARGRQSAVISQLYLTSQQATQLSLESGCVRNMQFEETQFTIRDLIATWLIRTDCVWKYPCSLLPCVGGATCVETDFDNFECVCAPSGSSDANATAAPRSCVKPEFNTDYLLVAAGELDELTFVTTDPIVVDEGGSTIISSSSHIHLTFNYRAFNLSETQVLFNVSQRPVYGRVELSVAGRSSGDRFTLRDLEDSKVRYVHDGSEELSDSMTLSIQFLCKPDQLPPNVLAAQRRGIKFVVVISVIQHNDVPRIILQRGDAITLIKNTKYFITTDLLTAADDDDIPANLKYIVEYEGGTAGGYFERLASSTAPSVSQSSSQSRTTTERPAISAFTQQELQERQILYVNRGASFARVRLRVTDNRAESDAVIVTFRGIELQIRTVNNTGTRINPGTAVTITNVLLATVSTINDVDVRYELTSVPLYGQIQRLRQSLDTSSNQSSNESNYWLTTRTFTQRQIDAGLIRYVHTEFVNAPARPFQDSFRFVPICVGVRGAEEEFLIRFVQVELSLVTNSLLELDAQSPNAVVSNAHLLAETNTEERADEIVYVLTVAPQHGMLILWQNLSAVEYRQQQLAVASRFTQANINAGHIVYRYNGLPPSARRRLCQNNRCPTTINDAFHFQLHAPGAISDTYEFRIVARVQLAQTRLINVPLAQVPEGEARKITSDNLFVEQTEPSRSAVVYEFRVLRPPMHGQLKRVDVRSDRLAVIEQNVTVFTTEQISNGEVLYQHDDSESPQDSFQFFVSQRRRARTSTNATSLNASTAFESNGDFVIYIALRNDNPPQSITTTSTFNVVISRSKCLTSRYLSYVDTDVDQTPASIIYTVSRLTNGFLFDAHNSSVRVSRFSQADVDRQRIMFQHSGNQVGRFTFSVSDEVHTVAGTLEVRASEPFIRIENNTRLTVTRNSEATISTLFLAIETNLDVDADAIRFALRTAPRYGTIMRRTINGASEFTYQDLLDGQVRYRHDASLSPSITPSSPPVYDSFAFHVSADNVRVDSDFYFMIIYTRAGEGDRRLQVVVHNVLNVADGESAILNSGVLRIEDGVSDPKDILLAVTREPRAGRLYMLNVPSEYQRDAPAPSNRQTTTTVATTAAVTASFRSAEYATGGNRALLIRMVDIEDGRVRYQHTQFGTFSDSIGFAVTSKYQQRRDIEVVVSIKEQPIAIVTSPVVADENSSTVVSVNAIRLNLFNPIDNTTRSMSNSQENVTYIVTNQPVFGRLVDTRQPSVRLIEFGGLALSTNCIAYVHERMLRGNNSLRTDTVTVAALWRSPLESPAFSKQSAPQTLRIAIRPALVRSPMIAHLRDVTVWMGTKNVSLSTSHLEAAADEGGDADIEFRVQDPRCGYLVNRRSSQKVLRFSQSDLRNGSLSFVFFANTSNMSESLLVCGFTFSVKSLIARYANLSSDPQNFLIQIIKPQITVMNTTGMTLKVFPKTTQSLNNSLSIITNAARHKLSAKITYMLQSRPKYGKLVRRKLSTSSEEMEEALQFTQDEVNSGIVFYDNVNWTSGSWSLQDAFSLDVLVNDGSNVLFNLSMLEYLVDIAISNLYATDVDKFIFVRPLDVTEGASKTLSGENFRSDRLSLKILELGHIGSWIDFALAEPCARGRITYNGVTLFTNTSHSFTQQDILSGFIAYQHDNSETRNDSCVLQVRMRKHAEPTGWTNTPALSTRRVKAPRNTTKNAGNVREAEQGRSNFVLLTNLTLRIRVKPINDHKLQRINSERLPITEGVATLIERSNLDAVDVDDLPEEIEYTFDEMSDVVREQLHLASCIILVNSHQAFRFSQKQINDGHVQIKYVSNPPEQVGDGPEQSIIMGSKDSLNIQLPFSVKDGQFEPFWQALQIRVEPIWLRLDMRPLEILQGSRRAYLRNDSLRLQTNLAATSIRFSEVTQAQFGTLMQLNENSFTPASDFTFQNVLMGQVYYNQVASNSPTDFFLFTLRAGQHAVYDIRMSVVVRSLVRPKPLTLNLTELEESRSVVFTKEALNADALWAKTGNKIEPTFTLIAAPKYGRLRKQSSIHAHARFSRSADVRAKKLDTNESFTFSEVKNSLIVYDLLSLPPRNKAEVIQLKISVDSPEIQPALEELTIQVASTLDWAQLSQLFALSSGETTVEAVAPIESKGGLQNEHIAALVLCGALLLLCIILFVLVKFCRRTAVVKRASNRLAKNCGLPLFALDNAALQKDSQSNCVNGEDPNSPLTPACFALCVMEKRTICDAVCHANGIFSSAPVTPCSPKTFPHVSDADDELGATSSGSDVPYGLPASLTLRSTLRGRSASRGASPPRHGILKNTRYREREIAADCFSADAQLNGCSLDDETLRNTLPHVLITTPGTVQRDLEQRLRDETRFRKQSIHAFQITRKSQSITALQSKPVNISLPKLVFTDVDHYAIPSPPPPPKSYHNNVANAQAPQQNGKSDKTKTLQPSDHETNTHSRDGRRAKFAFHSDASELSSDGSDDEKKVPMSDSSTQSDGKKVNVSLSSETSSEAVLRRLRVTKDQAAESGPNPIAVAAAAKANCLPNKPKRETFVFTQFSTETEGDSSSLHSAAKRTANKHTRPSSNTISGELTNGSFDASHKLLRQLTLRENDDPEVHTVVL